MKTLKERNILCGLMAGLLVVTLAASSPLQAAFVENDLTSSGDALLTLDTSTGLEWLDVKLTESLTYTQALAAYPGFRHATKAEVIALVEEFGIAWVPGPAAPPFAPANYTPVESMLALLSENPLGTGGNTPFHQAVYDLVPFSSTNAEISIVQLNLQAVGGKVTLPQGAWPKSQPANAHVGHYLVRIPVAVNQDPDCSGAAISDQSADDNCQATISGADVTGVTDPEGDSLTITVSPTTLSLGANTVTVTADDGNGGTCSTDIAVNVVDDTPPVITCAVEPSHGKQIQVLYSAQDNCELASVTAVIDIGCDTIPIEDGQNIKLKYDDDDCEFKLNRGLLKIESSSAVLTITATDAAGNVSTSEKVLAFDQDEDNDDDGNDEDDEEEEEEEEDDDDDRKKRKDKDDEKGKKKENKRGRDADRKKGRGRSNR